MKDSVDNDAFVIPNKLDRTLPSMFSQRLRFIFFFDAHFFRLLAFQEFRYRQDL